MSKRTNQELGTADLSMQWRAWGAHTALGCILWFFAPHSPSPSNGDDNGKTSEEHSRASRTMAELLEPWQSLWNSDKTQWRGQSLGLSFIPSKTSETGFFGWCTGVGAVSQKPYAPTLSIFDTKMYIHCHYSLTQWKSSIFLIFHSLFGCSLWMSLEIISNWVWNGKLPSKLVPKH
jgi:hypothetical protein